MTTLNIRIEEKTKKAASKTLARLGLDMSSAVKMFLAQVIKEDGIPFIPSNKAKQIRAHWDNEVEDVLVNSKRYNTIQELHANILK